jgi:sulfopyruvate decarboxylase TPP-binding subunit
MGFSVYRVTQAGEAEETVQAAVELAFESEQAVAVLLSQRLIGRKSWLPAK